ncbi:MAG: hypothetical protein AW07_01810 [Candidatus Accumulibacter sp. SK-11]|nr:MAG: hypothetical protein AW07_01810 [Candidatus Accumulibacter sp. SK-11]
MGAVRQRDACRCARNLLHGYDVRQVTEAATAVLLGGGDAKQTHGAQLAPEIGREEIVAVDGLGTRGDLAGGKAANAVAQQIDRFAMGETEARVFHVSVSLIGLRANAAAAAHAPGRRSAGKGRRRGG